jgi:putative ABC transport system ATP-binding protein
MLGTTRRPILQINDLSHRYSAPSGFELFIPDFALGTGETVLLLGPSGGGKSTLLNLISGVIQPNHGRIEICQQNICALSASECDRFRGEHIGLIYQSLNLIPWLSARENILLGSAFSAQRRARMLGSSAIQHANELLDSLNMPHMSFANMNAEHLSLGQQQRVAAARALIGSPELILADEPTSALDDENCSEFLQLLFSRLDRSRQSVLMVSHDRRIAERFDRVIDLKELFDASPATTERQIAKSGGRA